MPDIFGFDPGDYEFVRALQEHDGEWERYQEDNHARRRWASPTHDFDALGSWSNGIPEQYERAAEDAQAIGYLTSNVLSIQTQIDEVLYTAYRLPMFVAINTNIPEGARSYGVRVMNRQGKARKITAPGYDAPSATASESLVTRDLFWYGLDAEWSIDELRGAMFAGIPLDTESIEAAVTGSLETMESVALTGGEEESGGLCNLPTGSSNEDRVTSSAAPKTFAASTAVEIRNLINGTISAVIEQSRETLGRNLSQQGMTVYLPGTQYDLLTTIYIGDNAERTLMRSIMEDNPWTHFTKGNPIMIERLLELDSSHNPGVSQDRMIVTLRDSRIAEMGVSITPRVLRIMDKGRVVCAQVESKYSDLFVKRPRNVHYINNI